MRAASPLALLVAIALLAAAAAAAAGAQQPAPPAPAARNADAAASVPLLGGDATRLRAGSSWYEIIITDDSSTMIVGTHRVVIQEGAFAGAPAWMVVDHRESYDPFVAIIAADTVLLSRDRLVPRRWDAHAGDARLVAAFTNDSVYGGASAPMARRTFTLGTPPALVTSEGALDAMLQAQSFHRNWSAVATMLVADLGGARLVPVTLAMAHETEVEVPAGTFDAWVVHVGTAGTDRWIWIDKRTQVVVKTETRAPHMRGMLVERVLTHQP
ncbi:MAG: hypothetical protein H0X64_13780 [Gemmatimonadaceae bacterium]|nr:hypothetical protein [Gemmatimonadaceae bacterium]